MTPERTEVTWDPARVREITERIRLVPDRYRLFQLTLEQVSEHYAVPGPLLEELLDLGMPHRGHGRDRRFNTLDLENIGNALGLYIPSWRSMRFLAVTFGGIKNPGRPLYKIRSASSCPEPRHDGDCDIRPSPVLTAIGNADHVECDAGGVTVQVHLGGRPGDPVGKFIAPLTELACGLTFHYLPEELRNDLGFAMATGLADCHLSSRLLASNARLVDHPVRMVAGIIMSVPFLITHEWIQLEINGHWISLDPFFLNSLARWQIIDSEIWPPDLPVDDVYWRFPGAASFGEICLVTDHGRNSQGPARILNWRDVFVLG